MDENNLIHAPGDEPVSVAMEDGLPEAPDAPECDAPAAEENGWNIPRTSVIDVRFKEGGKVYYFDPGSLPIKTGDHVIVETARGVEYGIAANGLHQVPARDITGQLRPVLRLATANDEKTRTNNKAREKEAYRVCLQEIERLGLEMQLASAEVAFDGSKILFFFTADGRVDFRELVKSLASAFHTRIELRQIGVRDKAKMIGGLGMCGRPFCCSEFLSDFQPVSIKMAKTQNLSLNPTKISGTCGRLMCCLKYEQEAYEDLIRSSPKSESFVDTPEGRGTVTDVNLLRQTVKVRMEKKPDTVQCFHNCDICVWRNGKAKKTDPPIPEEWSPVSSDPNRKKKEETPNVEDYLPGGRAARSGERGESAPTSRRHSSPDRPRQERKPNSASAPQKPRETPAATEEKGNAAPSQPGQKKQQAPRTGKGPNNPPRKKRPEGSPTAQGAPAAQSAPAQSAAPAASEPGTEPKKKPANRRRRHHKPSGGGQPQGGQPSGTPSGDAN